MYQVGYAQNPSPHDPRFDDLNVAMGYALHICMGDSVIVVWKWEDENPIAICLLYQDDVYERQHP